RVRLRPRPELAPRMAGKAQGAFAKTRAETAPAAAEHHPQAGFFHSTPSVVRRRLGPLHARRAVPRRPLVVRCQCHTLADLRAGARPRQPPSNFPPPAFRALAPRVPPVSLNETTTPGDSLLPRLSERPPRRSSERGFRRNRERRASLRFLFARLSHPAIRSP